MSSFIAVPSADPWSFGHWLWALYVPSQRQQCERACTPSSTAVAPGPVCSTRPVTCFQVPPPAFLAPLGKVHMFSDWSALLPPVPSVSLRDPPLPVSGSSALLPEVEVVSDPDRCPLATLFHCWTDLLLGVLPPLLCSCLGVLGPTTLCRASCFLSFTAVPAVLFNPPKCDGNESDFCRVSDSRSCCPPLPHHM